MVINQFAALCSCKISVLTVLRTGYRKGKGSCESRFYDVVDRLFSTEARSRRNLVTGAAFGFG